MKASFVSIFGLLLLVALGVAFHFNGRYYEAVVRYKYECPMRLTALAIMISTELEAKGAYPTNLEFATEIKLTASKKRLHLHPLLCPGSDTLWVTSGEADRQADYVYVNWSKWFPGTNAVPNGFPLVYDRRLSNHSDKGIYVLMTDGSIIWDGGAYWVKRFMKEHPEFPIPLPE